MSIYGNMLKSCHFTLFRSLCTHFLLILPTHYNFYKPRDYSNQSANNVKWEVSYNYYQFGKLDWLICYQAASFKEFFFPVLENDIAAALASDKGGARKLQRLDRCRMILQNWIHELIDRSSTFIPEIQDIINGFFCLPTGPVQGYQ